MERTGGGQMPSLEGGLRLRLASRVRTSHFSSRRKGLEALMPFGWFAVLALAALVIGGALAFAT